MTIRPVAGERLENETRFNSALRQRCRAVHAGARTDFHAKKRHYGITCTRLHVKSVVTRRKQLIALRAEHRRERSLSLFVLFAHS